nr:MAG TPA: hypothetical protein [Caudoviricetes sp.]
MLFRAPFPDKEHVREICICISRSETRPLANSLTNAPNKGND